MFTSLMKSKRFAPLFWCQFVSAFNDNLLRNALVILILYKLASANGGSLVALGRRGADRALLHALGRRRRTGRQVRQGAPRRDS